MSYELNKNVNVLNSPLHSPVNLKQLDGKKIVTTIQYQLLLNLNLTLLEYDKNANLVTLLAEDYDINDREIIFYIKKGVKTISGHEIMGKDAEISLKRLIMTNDGSHSRLSDLLCPEEPTTKQSSCPGISSSNYQLKLIARKRSYIPFILSLLTNADNVILPLTALDSQLATSSITNFRETTGPYFIDNQTLVNDALEKIKLKLNPNHFLNDGKLALEVNYSKTDYDDILKAGFNYFHSFAGLKLETVKKLEVEKDFFSVHPTLQIKNTILLTTKKGRTTFSSKELIYFGLKIKECLLSSKVYPNITQPQTSYFPSESEGNLRDEQLNKITETYANIKTSAIKTPQKIKVGFNRFSYEKYKNAFRDYPEIEVIKTSQSPLFKNIDNVDMFLDTIDSSFTESLDLLQYNKTFGIFSITDEEMQKYIDSETKGKRIEILQNIHFNSLMEGRIINIGSAPYYTILSKDWVAEPSKFFAGYPVWKIKRKI